MLFFWIVAPAKLLIVLRGRQLCVGKRIMFSGGGSPLEFPISGKPSQSKPAALPALPKGEPTHIPDLAGANRGAQLVFYGK